MSESTIADDKARSDRKPAKAGPATSSRVLGGPLAAFGAIRYALGDDEAWVIGRLPQSVSAGPRRPRREPT
jgi:hypothetical protein